MKNNWKRLTSLVLALILALCCVSAFAEEEDPVVASFNGGEIRKSEAQAELDYVIEYYQMFGYDVSEYPDWMDSIRLEVLEMLVTDKVIEQKLAADNAQLITDERKAEIHAAAEKEYTDMLASFSFTDEEGNTSDDAETEEYLQSIGYTVESIEQEMLETEHDDALFRYIAGDVTVTEDDIAAAYDEQLASDTELFTEDVTEFEYAAMYEDSLITYHPDGFRSMQMITFSLTEDADLDKLYELLDARESVTEDSEADALNAQIALLYEAVNPQVDECLARLNNGEDFDQLMQEYSTDDSYAYEPFLSKGFYVYADSIMYDNAVRDAAMALENIGDVSEPVQGDYGVYIVKYTGDVTPGPVPLADVYDQVKETAINNKQYEAYDAAVAGWIAEANVEYFPEKLG